MKGGTFQGLVKNRINPLQTDCKFCGRVCAGNIGLVQHQIRCNYNPDKIAKPCGMSGKKGRNQYIQARELGLPNPVVSIETRIKISQKNKQRVWTDADRLKLSNSMKQAVINNPESYSAGNQGRVKTYDIDGVKLKGTWEVKFYNWCRSHHIDVDRPLTSFHYIWNGDRRYFPDFYLPKYQIYIEIKGFQTDRDAAKWDFFPEKLSIIKKDGIQKIDDDVFSIEYIINNLYK